MSKIYEYGSYDDYIKAQKDTTNFKYGKINYVKKGTIVAIHEALKNENVEAILCHGTRSGGEQKLFKKQFECYVWGSELCEKAQNDAMTTIWDFNQVNDDWVGKFDIVYTNSFDHCITPVETLKVWKDQLKDGGRLCIDWSNHQNGKGVTIQDPLNATDKEVTEFAEQAGMYLEQRILDGKSAHAGTVLTYRKK